MTTRLAIDRRQRLREELREFLRTRRARLAPVDVGLPEAGRRRTPGLRREEVALLAGIGVSWYTWLEQGRDITVSAAVVDAISDALRLSDAERAHLYLLAGLNPPPPRPTGSPAMATLGRLLDTWMPHPAYVRDRHWNILARNSAADAVFGFADPDNCLVAFFTNPVYRARYVEREIAAQAVVAELRAQRAQYPEDEGLDELVETLHSASDEFTRLWDRHDVGRHAQATKPIQHPDVGLLMLEGTILTLPDHPDLRVVLYAAQAGTDTAEKLARLA
jgi:transcriptional regulator with XRE-family HTH domain